ncbi:hypothetical protein TIFTF001_040137 [Ficus carica]|uniref:Uncharacterized protein n=1 Tax=Ficus carica TaxID=3494 RepID=A0AA87YSI4_FICCA|nr:hypothetical protein TIFTF001_040137 [Ficus carica]
MTVMNKLIKPSKVLLFMADLPLASMVLQCKTKLGGRGAVCRVVDLDGNDLHD